MGNIGIPLDTVSCFIIAAPDESQRPPASQFRVLPVGEVGELAVGGHQLARGYINRPEQTAASFIQSPYGQLYRTGDKACLHASGFFECLGRLSDGQVKLRGQRIELGEIEQAALKAPGCHAAVAAVISNVLVLFCATNDERLNEEPVLQACKKWLPSFMVPGDCQAMREFPRLASGKVDRGLLKARYVEAQAQDTVIGPTVGHDGEAFRDETHQTIHSIAQSVLGVTISTGSKFAPLSLDSLTAIRFGSALRASGFNVSAVDILACRDVLGVCSIIKKNGPGDSPAQPGSSSQVLPDPRPADNLPIDLNALGLPQNLNDSVAQVTACIPAQLAMLYASLKDSRLYTNTIELEFPAGISPDTIKNWFRLLAHKNDMLRSGFVQSNTGFVRLVWETLLDDQIHVIRDSFMTNHPPENDLEKWLRNPLNIQILDNNGYDGHGSRVLIHIHHALYDGWSIDVLLTRLNDLARGQNLEQSSTNASFRDVVSFYDSTTSSSEIEATSLEFWTSELLGYIPPPVSSLRHSLVTSKDGFVVESALLSTPQHIVAEKLAPYGLHPAVIFQASVSLLWATILGTDDIVIGTVMSGRTIPVPGVESVFGPCITTVPSRTRLRRCRTVDDLLLSTHRSNRDMLPHSTLALSKIKAAADIAGGIHLFDLIFVYQQSLFSDVRASEGVKEADRRDFLEAKLLVEVEALEGRYYVRATSREEWAEASVVSMVLRQLDAVVRYLVESIESDVSPTQVRNSLADNFPSQTNVDVSPAPVLGLVESFERTKKRVPHRIALSFLNDDSTVDNMTFGELDSHANKVAKGIQNVGSRSPIIAIMMPKSMGLYVGILGILKSGCAYLPILPETPLARRQAMLLGAEAELCIVDDGHEIDAQAESRVKMVKFKDLISAASASNQAEAADNFPDVTKPLCEQPAYLIYTSGTTGTPKCVLISHHNIASNIAVLNKVYANAFSGDSSALLQSCSQVFDVSVFDIFWTWTNGQRLCAAASDTLFRDIDKAIDILSVTHLSMTPTVMGLICREKVPRVQFLVSAGEKLNAAVMATWRDVLYQGE